MPYIKEAFDVFSLEQAKDVVLSYSHNDEFKFHNETNYFVDTVLEHVDINDETCLLDFGCGMGRLSKEFIDRKNCYVFGVDLSQSMLNYADQYVNNSRKFLPMQAYFLENTIDVAICVFVLQHVEFPKKEIDNILNVLKPNGYMVLLNENKRFIPNSLDSENYVVWDDDGFDVEQYINQHVTKVVSIPYIDNRNHISIFKK
jgi:2-polyprenyl-3-methyl-5-hydroxy-6-metoxy-1,4-benzoquinol methylase